MTGIEFTDRYQALGIVPPPPGECCKGQCEGTGLVPIYRATGDTRDGGVRVEDETDPELLRLWDEAEASSSTDDGWHFVQCPTCGGSGRDS